MMQKEQEEEEVNIVHIVEPAPNPETAVVPKTINKKKRKKDTFENMLDDDDEDEPAAVQPPAPNVTLQQVREVELATYLSLFLDFLFY